MTEVWIVLILIWAVSACFELAAGNWPDRFAARLSSYVALAFSGSSVGILLATEVNALSVLFILAAAYRAINISRILNGRLERHNLRRASLVSSRALLVGQLGILVLWHFRSLEFASHNWLILLAASQLIVSACFLSTFISQLKKTKFAINSNRLTRNEMPTLTVAIPAKNETKDLEDCLTSLLTNDYPKLEVLVLDDSAGSKTGEVIRTLAHDGVRFILGNPPKGHWLAKNSAYERLASEANGEIILFCGVDVRFSPDSLEKLVSNFITTNLQMLSIMPLNQQNPKPLLVQPMRYFWELAKPRFGVSQPVLSTCWMIQRDLLIKTGGFKAVANEVVPERYFANSSVAGGGKYSFLRSSPALAISSLKPQSEQRFTALRTRYPLLHKNLASAAGTSLFTLIWLTGPFALLIVLPLCDFSIYGEILASLASLVWLAIYGKILKLNFAVSWFSSIIFIFATLTDVILVNHSMIKYEFGRVLWKGRDAVPPVMGLNQKPYD